MALSTLKYHSSCFMMVRLGVSALCLLSWIHRVIGDALPGDNCEIEGLLQTLEDGGGGGESYTSRIAGGPGCLLGGQTGCFCQSTYFINAPYWVWTCGNDVSFGPPDRKTCPETLLYPEGFSGELPSCNPVIHPSGLSADDPPCGYFSCANDGSGETAICGCIDLSNFGLGSGPSWVCVHSGCGCAEGQVPPMSPSVAPATEPPREDDDRKTRVPEGTTLAPTQLPPESGSRGRSLQVGLHMLPGLVLL